jgi:hypothetical protein
MARKICRARGSEMKRYLYFGLILIVVLLIYGIFRFPTALSDFGGLVGDILILVVYSLLIRFWFSKLEQKTPQVIRFGSQSGLVIGIIFAGEMILEYILLPADNSKMGLVEYSSVFIIFFSISLWIVCQTGRFRNGIFAAIVSAMIGSILWLISALAIFYLFHGTPQQTQVFRAEGNFDDFAHSGMTNFDAFIMQDFWGAGFFHSILLPLLASILGSIGSSFGIFFTWIRKRNLSTI